MASPICHISKFFPKLLQSILLRISRSNLWCGIGFEHLDPYIGERPVIIALWHEYLAVAPAFLPLIAKRKWRNPMSMCALVSLHEDGQLAGRIANEFGVMLVAGSTTRGGFGALRKLSQITKHQKTSVFITPDGPKGPRRTSMHGLPIGHLNDIPVLPVVVESQKALRLSSWDSMIFPLPLNTGSTLQTMAILSSPFFKDETKAVVVIRLNATACRGG